MVSDRWTRHMRAWALAIGLAAGLAACGGGGGGSGDGGSATGPVAGADYFPLAVGDRWTYREAGGLSSARVTGTRTAGGTTVFVVRFDEPGDSFEEQYGKSAAGVYVVPDDTADPLERALAAVPILKLPVVAGESFVPLDRTLADYADFDGDGRAETLALRAEVTVVGFEAINTPAGTWTGVAHTRTVLRQSVTLTGSNRPVVVTITSDDWYAPDVGPVRNVTTIVGNATSSTESNVQAWRVGSRRSENVAPTVVVRTPADGSLATTAAVRVRFSEPMDRVPGAAPGFLLRGPNGQPVAGDVVWADDTTFDFFPAQTLATGRFEATLAPGFEDLAGNTLAAAQTWSFMVDATGPSVLAISPAAGAVEVPLNSVLRITFDEDLDATTVKPDSFELSPSGGPPVPLTVALEGARTVLLTPTQPLERSRHYVFRVGNALRDRLGNHAPPFQSTFQADPGRFAAPRYPSGLGSNVQAMALADFNGDGRTDMAVIGDGTGTGSGGTRLRLALQASDGSLGPAEALDHGASCAAGALQAADLDGDGRTDLVVAGNCGLQVLAQTDGGFSTSVLSAAYADIKAVVPIAADGGRPALVVGVLQAGNDALEIWRQTAPGVFGPPQPLPGVMSSAFNAAVADLDGDRRADLAFAGLLASNNGPGLGMLYQQADGSFGAAREWSDPGLGPRGPTSVAAGDLDGDGRPDLVFSTGGNSPTVIGLVPQRADGSFGPGSGLPTFDIPTQIRVADVTGDGRADVLVGHLGWLAVGLYVQGSGGLAAEQLFEAPYGCLSHNTLTSADVDGDGLIDIGYCGSVLRQRPQAEPAGAASRGPWAQRLRGPTARAGLLRGGTVR